MEKTPLSNFYHPKYWPTWLGFGFLRLLSMLPMPVLATMGHGIGMLFYYLGTSRRNITLRNLQSCFPQLEESVRQRIAKRHFSLLGQSFFMTPANMFMSPSRFNRLIELEGKQQYEQILASGQNIIVLAPHFVSLDVAGLRLAQERPMVSMYQYAKNQLADELVKRGRLRFGGELVERKESMRNLIRLIRNGYVFYYLPDQDAGRKGVFVPFFNDLASTYSILGKFAQMTDAVVVPCTTHIKPWGQGYKVVLGEPMQNFPCGDEIKDTTMMNQQIERMIEADIAQYFWVHKRFKTRPAEEKQSGTKFYK